MVVPFYSIFQIGDINKKNHLFDGDSFTDKYNDIFSLNTGSFLIYCRLNGICIHTINLLIAAAQNENAPLPTP